MTHDCIFELPLSDINIVIGIFRSDDPALTVVSTDAFGSAPSGVIARWWVCYIVLVVTLGFSKFESIVSGFACVHLGDYDEIALDQPNHMVDQI